MYTYVSKYIYIYIYVTYIFIVFVFSFSALVHATYVISVPNLWRLGHGALGIASESKINQGGRSNNEKEKTTKPSADYFLIRSSSRFGVSIMFMFLFLEVFVCFLLL